MNTLLYLNAKPVFLRAKVIQKGDYTEQAKRMKEAFDKTNQVRIYAPTGPNSNTWAHQLLLNAGYGRAEDF